ncbi:MAG: XRE family transcriptional regulator [Spirochaetaceae bacterium]|nr:MAG: XRE family transcriptional regulator [Spirochaetaceae bacterium]
MDYPVRTAAQLGVILQALRKDHGRTQQEAAETSGLFQKSVSLLERTPERATVRSLLALVSALDAEIVIRSRQSDDGKASVSPTPEEW